MTGIVIVVTSGKGGVGKTTSSAAIGAALALRGHKTVVVDFDIGLRNLDLVLGVERRVVFDFIQVIEGQAKLGQALIKDKRIGQLYILAASQTRDKDALDPAGVTRVMEQLKENFSFIICDSPAGIEHGAIMAFYHADHAIVVTNPEISSIRDADKMIGFVGARSRHAEMDNPDGVQNHLLITRYDPTERNAISLEEVQNILQLPLLGIIPEDSSSVKAASNTGTPVSLDDTTKIGRAYQATVARLLGETALAPEEMIAAAAASAAEPTTGSGPSAPGQAAPAAPGRSPKAGLFGSFFGRLIGRSA